MSKPEDIPADVLIAARAAAMDWYRDAPATLDRMVNGECDSWPIVRSAISAILDERERCAKVAEAERLTGEPPAYVTPHEIRLARSTVAATAKSIATSIRQGAKT